MKKLNFWAMLIVFNAVFLFHLAAASADILSIPASALLPKDDTVTWSTNGVSLQSTSNSSQSFLAPVFLPDQAIIRSITLEAYDNSGGDIGGYVKLELVEYRYNTYFLINDADTGQTEAFGDIRVMFTAYDFIVDNAEYSYGIAVTFYPGTGGWPELRFYKVIIEYDVPQIIIAG